jgi:hypothetical protein
MKEFENWFKKQPFYLNMLYINGNQLFIHEGGVYRCLAVQMAYAAWCSQKAVVNNLEVLLYGECN